MNGARQTSAPAGRKKLTTSLSMEQEDFDFTPFVEKGGLGKAHQLFGPRLNQLLEELNETLAT